MLKNKINIKKESPYLIMGLPAVIVFVTFFILPLFFTIRYSFYNWTNFSPDITFAAVSYTHLTLPTNSLV